LCGIAGFAGLGTPAEMARAWVGTMCGEIVHRGPDGQGCFVSTDGTVALGMRRLAIIDVAGGWQPIGNETGTIQVVFNGEVYNFRALRAELERLGHTFATRSDTETIVHGYEEWGDRVVEHLRGMFAIALWDGARQRLLLARDRLGIKPLYVWLHQGGLAFASELKALRALPTFEARPSPAALIRFLAFAYVPDPHSAYEGVRKLLPGHTLTWQPGCGMQEQRYWEPRVAELTDISEAEAVREIRRLLEDSVRCHLESDVPLGAFLSGGIDSSAVVAQMSRLMDRPVKTFTIGFDEVGHNEAPHAAEVARALSTEHTELVMRPDVDQLIEDLVLWFDEPFADSSALPTYLVSKLAREHVTVALSGDGGDELFGGYTRYWKAQHSPTLPDAVRPIVRQLAARLPHGARGRNYLINLCRTREGRYADTVALPLLPWEGGVVRSELVTEDDRFEMLLANLFHSVRDRDFPAQMALVDVMSYLPGDILTKVDRMSMRVSLEARVPLLDHLFAEFALSLPSRLKFRGGVGKWIFRKAIEPLVPASVLARPKSGFAVPLGQWFRGPLRHRLEALSRHDSPVFQYTDGASVLRILEEHRVGRRDHSYMIWRLLVLNMWLTKQGSPA